MDTSEKNNVMDGFTVKNVGGVAESIESMVRPVFLVSYGDVIDGEEGYFEERVVVPIVGYDYPMSRVERLGVRSGEISKVYASEPLIDLFNSVVNWERYINSSQKLKNNLIVEISIAYLININVDDILDENQLDMVICVTGYQKSFFENESRFFIDTGVTVIGGNEKDYIKDEDDAEFEEEEVDFDEFFELIDGKNDEHDSRYDDEEDNFTMDSFYETALSCFGGLSKSPQFYTYSENMSDEERYEYFIECFMFNLKHELLFSPVQIGMYSVVSYPDGHEEFRYAR